VPAVPMFACAPAADHEDRIAFVHQILVLAVGMLGSASAVELRGSAFAGWMSPACTAQYCRSKSSEIWHCVVKQVATSVAQDCQCLFICTVKHRICALNV
jgi:hypothetical protein